MNKRTPIVLSLVLYIFLACNLPGTTIQPISSAGDVTPAGPGVLILSPENGAQLPADAPVQISYTASGGPFLEIDLSVDDRWIASVPITSPDPTTSGSIAWSEPTAGTHRLRVQAVTMLKEVYEASVDVSIGVSSTNLNPPSVTATTADPEMSAARQRVILILRDQYGLNMTAPPVGRKSRPGVTTDPWTSAIFYGDWLISISLYADGSETVTAYPVNHADPNAQPNFIDPNNKLVFTHVCRPSGTIKLLAVFVDYGNLGVTRQEALDALSQAVDQINEKYAQASRAVGVQTPILQIQATPAYLVSPGLNPNHLLTPEIVRSITGYDVAQFDVLAQIDLDANNTYAAAANFQSYGFAWGGCGDPPIDVNMWIGLTARDQLYEGSDARLRSTLGHEILHDMGYPIGKTGVHEWICGDGSVPDPYDQCDQDLLPTLMLGWTDTDGDGIVEILDTTPYGLLP